MPDFGKFQATVYAWTRWNPKRVSQNGWIIFNGHHLTTVQNFKVSLHHKCRKGTASKQH